MTKATVGAHFCGHVLLWLSATVILLFLAVFDFRAVQIFAICTRNGMVSYAAPNKPAKVFRQCGTESLVRVTQTRY